MDYDRRSFALNCYTGVGPSEHTVETTSADWQSITLGNNAFVYYNKDGWFADQWTYQPTEVCFSDSPPSVLTPSSYIFPLSTTFQYISPIGAYSFIPFYAYTTKVGGYSSFYMTGTLPSGPNPTQNETPILSIFHSDGKVSTYSKPQVDQKITFSDANPSLTIEITNVGGFPTFSITYSFPDSGGLC
jgi:hypothetical protein